MERTSGVMREGEVVRDVGGVGGKVTMKSVDDWGMRKRWVKKEDEMQGK